MLRTQRFWLVAICLAIHAGVVEAGELELDEVFPSFREADRYLQANFAGSFPSLDSGGFNTLGGFFNTGENQDTGVGFGGAIGLAKSSESFRIRTEFEGMWRENTD